MQSNLIRYLYSDRKEKFWRKRQIKLFHGYIFSCTFQMSYFKWDSQRYCKAQNEQWFNVHNEMILNTRLSWDQQWTIASVLLRTLGETESVEHFFFCHSIYARLENGGEIWIPIFLFTVRVWPVATDPLKLQTRIIRRFVVQVNKILTV